MTEAVIFDLDGTLIQLPIDYESLFQEFSRIMKTNKVRPLTETIPKLGEKTRKKVFRVWDEAEHEAFEKMTAKKEGVALYEQFYETSKALITMQGKPLVRRALKQLGLTFNLVISRENSLNREEQLKLALGKLGTSPKNVLFIGDTEEDSRAAEKVGCHFRKV